MTTTSKKRVAEAAKRGNSLPADRQVPAPVITKTMTVSTILGFLPEAEPVLAEYGLHCFHCSANTLENLEDGCRTHGFEDAEIDELVDDLNTLLQERPQRPDTLTLTKVAAEALMNVMESEGRMEEGLQVIADEHGSFCMEFKKSRADDEREFSHPEVPTVRIFASAVTLGRIGGATIDFRDGRFKLDLPGDTASGCACGGNCDCP
ncbi:DUF1858 domain-containing protein [Candidatus Peregrinibacteria bacterium]|nr:DUF1858 domain-containing protein [Candidatus Peregrinibacteria bacterium]